MESNPYRVWAVYLHQHCKLEWTTSLGTGSTTLKHLSFQENEQTCVVVTVRRTCTNAISWFKSGNTSNGPIFVSLRPEGLTPPEGKVGLYPYISVKHTLLRQHKGNGEWPTLCINNEWKTDAQRLGPQCLQHSCTKKARQRPSSPFSLPVWDKRRGRPTQGLFNLLSKDCLWREWLLVWFVLYKLTATAVQSNPLC